MKVLVAIPSEPVRSSVVRDLKTYKSVSEVIECADSGVALSNTSKLRPDVVLIAADLQPEDGFVTIQKILAQVPGVSAVLVALNPAPSDFRRALQAGARDLLEIPVDKKELFATLEAAAEVSKGKRTALERIAADVLAEKEPKVARRIVVASTKGGTGKTFIAINIAVGLAAAGKRTALVDLDLQFGDAAIALGLVPERTLFDLVQGYADFDSTLMEEFMLRHASGLSVLPAPLYPDEAEQVTVSDVKAILEVVQSSYDFVVVDTPPFFEERVLVALDWADHVLLVANPDIPTIKNLKTMLRTLGLMAYPEDKLIVVMNRAGTKVGLDLKESEKHLGQPIRVSISSSIEVPRALNAGEALLLSRPREKVSKELAKLVESLRLSTNGAPVAQLLEMRRNPASASK
ncbi:MAG: AAA family ATPase [Thermoleophilia bacterium]|nr:AAA family ATPase [Thermoleophilia bacterium]